MNICNSVSTARCRAELNGHVARYRANRDLLIRTLSAAGLTRFAPAEGALLARQRH